MSYELAFHPQALKEWKNLGETIKEQFKKKLKERLENPYVPKDKLVGFQNVYKIKLKTVGYRLAYEVMDEKVVIVVLSVGKRENNKVYNALQARFEKS
jgi:mRNA interferase RelE/StbE